MHIPRFYEITGNDPYPWQRRAFARLLEGKIPEAADIPTGLGKTSIVLMHLLALVAGAPLPRRVAYVVDRRAVVDQTATILRLWVHRLGSIPEIKAKLDRLAAFDAPVPVTLAILRGGLADDGEWRMDPARPAVLVGTVDMIGSRLLFSGYGNGRSRRAMDAGLIGFDTAVYLDEAHLSPAFASLLGALERFGEEAGEQGLRTMRLSATQQASPTSLQLAPEDHQDPRVKRRLTARKQLSMDCALDRKGMHADIVEQALSLPGSVLIYVTRVQDAKAIFKLMREQKDRVAILTGTLRGAERSALMDSAVWKAFQSGRQRSDQRPDESYWLISTAAGEVGVDLDADHAVMDLCPFDGMVQRLGRINRDGSGAARVRVVVQLDEINKIVDAYETIGRKGQIERDKVSAKLDAAKQKLSELRALPKPNQRRIDAARKRVHAQQDKLNQTNAKIAADLDATPRIELLNTHNLLAPLTNAAPLDLRGLPPEQVRAASAKAAQPVPLHPETLLALALTSEPAGLDIDPLLHGIGDQGTPDLYLAWRRDVALLTEAGDQAASEALGFFPPRPAEIARVPIGVGKQLLEKALQRLQTVDESSVLPLILRDARGRTSTLQISDARGLDRLPLANATVLLPPEAGGLRAGLPDPDSKAVVEDIGDEDDRVRVLPGESMPDWLDGAMQLRIPLGEDDDADDTEPPELLYLSRSFRDSLSTEDSDITRFAASPQTLEDHNQRVAAAALRIAIALGLEPPLRDALEQAGRGHDIGKALILWQRAAGARGTPMAKARLGRFRPGLLGGYRHEFGSLTAAERAGADELTLHLIAAHHGWARPGFPDPRQWGPELPEQLAEIAARGAAERFVRLQREHGPWRLAWLEALLKCADARVSSGRDQDQEQNQERDQDQAAGLQPREDQHA